jgi:hypothetical protein
MTEITIKPPAKDKPGYLRRMRELGAIQEEMNTNPSLATFDKMIDFVLKHAEVSAPEGTDLREALLDLSEEQFKALTGVLQGDKDNSAVPPPSGA